MMIVCVCVQKFDLCVIGLNSYTSENDLRYWLSIYSANVKRRFKTFAQAVVHLAWELDIFIQIGQMWCSRLHFVLVLKLF